MATLNSSSTTARLEARISVDLHASLKRAAELQGLQQRLLAGGHVPLAVEMEGAAVAQVCFDYGLPFAAVRTISDRADDAAHVDFPRFVRDVASPYAQAIMTAFLRLLPNQ